MSTGLGKNTKETEDAHQVIRRGHQSDANEALIVRDQKIYPLFLPSLGSYFVDLMHMSGSYIGAHYMLAICTNSVGSVRSSSSRLVCCLHSGILLRSPMFQLTLLMRLKSELHREPPEPHRPNCLRLELLASVEVTALALPATSMCPAL